MSFFGPDLRNGLPIGLGSLTALARAVAAVAPPPPPATDSFFKYVTLLLHGDGTNGAQNNTFLDGSTNNFTITRNGNTTQGSFSPFSQTGWSNYFDGTGDYLTVPTNAALGLATGDFTVECWVNVTGGAGTYRCAISFRNSSLTAIQPDLYIWNTNVAVWYVSGAAVITGTTNLTGAGWAHIAVVRNSGNTRLYVNGVQEGSTYVDSNNYPAPGTTLVVGSNPAVPQDFIGYISNARIVKGTAVYTANFTPPTAPLTAITNTSLLTCQSNRFIDNSSNAFAITRNGDVRVEAFSPFNPSTTYSTANVGGSGYFDGTGDYLTVPDNAALDLGAGDFTIELWAYYLATGGGSGRGTIAKGTTTGASFLIFQGASNELGFYASSNGTTWDIASNVQFTASLQLNTWHHIAVTRSSTTFRLFLNGTQTNTFTSSASLIDNASAVDIGTYGALAANAYISNVRILKGTAQYTANFTPPTAPLTAITNTSLLLNFTNGGIFDNASQTVLETVGNAQVSTTQKKYGTGSMYFDGTGDRLVMPARPPMAVGSGNFTIEGWVYRLDTNTRGVFQLSGTAGGLQANTTTNLALGSDTGSVWRIYANNSAYNSTATWVINTWYHFALVRSSGVTTLYINGVSVITQADTTNYTGQNLCVGGFYDTTFLLNGYIDDLRITNGYARYTANFTPPTAAFPDN